MSVLLAHLAGALIAAFVLSPWLRRIRRNAVHRRRHFEDDLDEQLPGLDPVSRRLEKKRPAFLIGLPVDPGSDGGS